MQRRHRAYHDALATAKLYQSMAHFYEEKEPKVFKPQPLAYKVKKKRTDNRKTDRISHKAYATEEYFYGNGHTYTDKELRLPEKSTGFYPDRNGSEKSIWNIV